jgi:YggT family protein
LRDLEPGASVITILYEIVNEILNLYKWAVILAAVFSMLVSFGVLDTRNRLVWTIGDFLYRVTEPALRPIRNMLPNFGGLDISPLVLILLIWVAQEVLRRVYIAIAFGNLQSLVL